MGKSRFKLSLYLYADKIKWLLYIGALLVVIIPILIVIITNNSFTESYSKLFVNISIIFILIAKILTAYVKTIEERSMHWTSIGYIIALVYMLLSNTYR